MIARLTSVSLGLLAFAVSTFAGLYAQNPVTVTLYRSILALVVFSILGLAVGHAAQKVATEHLRIREAQVRQRYPDESGNSAAASRPADASPTGAFSASGELSA